MRNNFFHPPRSATLLQFKFQFGGQCPLTMRHALHRSNYILWARSTGRFLYSAYGIRWVAVCCMPSGGHVGGNEPTAAGGGRREASDCRRSGVQASNRPKGGS